MVLMDLRPEESQCLCVSMSDRLDIARHGEAC